jgi:hypothetical protein
MAAKGINDNDWTQSLFVTKTDINSVTRVTIPKNMESFTDSLFMIAILKVFQIKNYVPVLSEKELPKAVLDTKEGAFFAGFVAASLRPTTGEFNQGSSKFAKGIRAHQTYSVEMSRGKATHLRTGGMSKLTERLSRMKGFTQEYWGLRGTLATLFKSLPASRVTNLNTYVLSKNELLKQVKTRLQYENGGCYRPEEIAYLGGKYQEARGALTAFLDTLGNPTDQLANNFGELYARVKTRIDSADNEIKGNLAARARILFPQDKKKSTQMWAKKPLIEKLADLSEEKLAIFAPETLPGIQGLPAERADKEPALRYISRRYPTIADNEPKKDVVLSWFNLVEDLS